MATLLQHKRSGVGGSVPSTSALELGEIAINTSDGFLYLKRSDGVTEEVYRIRGEPLSTVGIVDNQFTGDGSTTQFTLSAKPEDDQFVIVTIDGVTQHTNAYSLNGAVLTFSEAPATGDTIETRVFAVRTNALELRDYKSYVYTISSSTTSITGTDDNGAVLEYDISKVEVYYNGVRLVQGPDYTANDGVSISLNAAVSSGTVEVVSLSKASFIDNNAIRPFDVDLSTTNQQLVDRFQKEDYRSAKYLVQATNGTDYHVTEVLIMHDGTDVYVTEYGTMFSASSLITITADISNDYVRLLATPANATTTEVKGQRITVTV